MAEEMQPEGGLSPEEEIRQLEQRLEAKKKELAEQGQVEQKEKEVLREVLREHIEQSRQAPAAPMPPIPATNIPTQQKSQPADETKKAEREAHIRALVELAMRRTIQDAVKMAESESPYLLDELHDHLVDDYYDKLVALRKVKEL